MAKWKTEGLFFIEPSKLILPRGVLGPLPRIPESGWKPPTEWPNIRDAPWISLDTETYDPELRDYGPGWARGRGHIVGVSLAAPSGKWYFPMRHTVQPEMNLDPETVLSYLRWALGGRGDKLGANITYDIGWLKQEGVEVVGDLYDCQFAQALIDETSKVSLETLGEIYLNHGKFSGAVEDWIRGYYGGSSVDWRSNLWRAPVSLVGPYAEDDASMPAEILMKQLPILEKRGLMAVMRMECDLIRLMVDMRFAGQQVDVPFAERLKIELTDKAAILQGEVDYIAGCSVNTDAAADMAKAFDNLGLQYFNTTPTKNNPAGKPSFTGEFLETVDHIFAEKVLELKEINKIVSTFIQSYLLDSNVNGKIFCTFNQMMTEGGGARTGRYSSSSPNLQNIPSRSKIGRRVREAFIPDYGHLQLRDHDLSQIEYKMLIQFAVGAGIKEVIAELNRDTTLDFHNLIGDTIFNVSGTRINRSDVKGINFGLLYGKGLAALARALKLSLEDAKALIAAYHAAIPFVKETQEDTEKEIDRTGMVQTILGRQSHFDLWEPAKWGIKKADEFPLPYHAARGKWNCQLTRAFKYRGLNYKLQGSAAELMKMAMLKNYQTGVFAETGVPRLTVHDELLFSDPGGVRDEAWREMQHNAENAIAFKVPLQFNGQLGKNWAEAH
jgi:DNA polymerase-1